MIKFLKDSKLIILVLLWSACNTSTIKPPKPFEGNYMEPVKPISGIAIPFLLNLNAIGASINQQYPQFFYTDDSFDNNGNDNLKVNIIKRENVGLRAIGNAISVNAPLRIEGVYRIKKSVFGMEVSHEQKFGFDLAVLVQSVPSIEKDWSLKMNSKGNIRWDDLPSFEIAGVKVDFPKLFGNLIQGQVDKLVRTLDNEIPKSIDIKKQLNENWQKICTPIQVDAATNSWLQIRPKQVFYAPLQGFDSIAQLNIALYSIIEIVSGQKPTMDSTNTIPSILQNNKLNDKISLMLNTEVTYDQINAMIAQQLNGKSIKLEAKEYNIDILDAKVFGAGEKLLIGVKVNGKVKKGFFGKKIKGIIYFEGIPVYDANKQSIRIKDFELTIKTKDILLKSAQWLANSILFKQSIEKQLEFSIAKPLADAKKLAEEAVNKTYNNTIQLAGNITHIAPAQVYIKPNAIRVDIKAEGKIGVTVKGF
jgi:hypothetical protein